MSLGAAGSVSAEWRGPKGKLAGAAPGLRAESPAPPFSIRKQAGIWWLFWPEGQRFFSVGVCCVHQGALHSTFDPENPGYAAWQHYDDSLQWAEASLRRLKSWRFTTLGGWSDFATLRQCKGQTLCLTPVLHIGSTAGAPWWDMWDPKNLRRMEDVAREQILPLRDDPRLLGYYSDNELGWWNATLWKMTLEQPPSSGQRRRLIQLLRETYQNDWKKLLQDFDPENADGWRQLRRGGMLFLKSGGNGIRVMRQFLGLLAERYYQLMRDIIRKYDSRALFLGDRYQSFYYPEVARASAAYVDAVSSNLNASWSDGTFVRWHLDTLHALTGKPILVSEFYLAARDNRSGNRNSQGLYPVAATQPARAVAVRRTLESLLKIPWVIGADWFQYADQPTHGRADGENFNFGLIDIADQPYDEVTAAFASLDPAHLKAQPAPPRLDAADGAPRAPDDPFAHFEPTEALMHWDRERGFVKASTQYPLADLYVCWSPRAIYLGVFASDIVEAAYYRDSFVPKSDRALWIAQINGHEPVRARIGAGREPLVSSPGVRVENLSGINLSVRNVAIMEIPARLLGKPQFNAGDTIELSSTLLAHCQAYRMEWKARFTLYP
ncbi:MAG TPA: hypothetical protein VEO53_04340 [Candidatus Binatia bacterium]|nr:hypothetical protein [Candidatus Binatia bacterium]